MVACSAPARAAASPSRSSRCPYRFRAGGDRREFGFLALLVLLGLIASVVIRVLQRAKREADAFAALAMAGLATMFGLQASINLAVNTALIPAKGMTLPFISYGGSSLVATAFAMGLVLAMSRRRPEAVLPAGPAATTA